MSESDHTRLRPAAPVEDPATRLRDPAPDPTLLRPDQQAGSTEIRADVTRQRSAESGPGASSPADQLSTDAEGRPVIKNRFVLTRQIGRGGMGIVYAAIDRRKQELRDPNPLVALKILNPEFRAHPDSLMALQREAGRAQSLAHPNIATVFDFDRDGDNVYLTMELLQGRPLDVVLKQARERGVPREEALSIIRGIAEALAYAHRKGIVHSDLKPGNVFVLEDGTTKLLDFGIARAVPSVAAKVADVFDAGSLGAYTEAYATCEMVSGSDPHPADDMFALGVIAYELLGGAHPYQSQSIQRAQELGLKPVALKGLKHRQAKILARCIAFERDARPKDAKEFLDQFFGISSFQKSLIAASLIFALVAAFLWYRNYTDAGPAVSFEQLPLATQQLFESRMTEGDRAWSFFEHDGNSVALWDAIEQYAGAYDLHPRNRQAVKGLRRAADGLLNQAGIDVAQRREIAQSLQKRNEFLAKYSEVADAAK